MTSVIRKLLVNGFERPIEAPPQMRLIDVIREVLKLTGTKEGCGEGECGACTILINDDSVDSCLVLFGQLSDGDRITTIEGLGDITHLTPLQKCFIHEGGTQCGICTPGMIISAHALLKKNPNPSREEIGTAIAGNLCRCTGYVSIVDSIEKAAAVMRGDAQ